MIPRTEPACQAQSWQQILADTLRDPVELFALLELNPDQLPYALKAAQSFSLRAPRPFVNRIRKGDVNDPLLRQILPLGSELEYQPGFSADPLEENHFNPRPGLIHKYHGRVLLIISGGCAINCRYCFRRHFPYDDNNPSRLQWRDTLQYIARDESISEVILSGGDPLVASDKMLAELTEALADIPHLKRLRIHSRLPIVIPQRINRECLDWVTATRLQTVMVIHSNHPNEIDGEVGKALTQLLDSGVTLLNQTVLLAGVNDSSTTLAELSERLFEYGTLPYYLHLLDRVQGAAHFDVSETQAKLLYSELLAKLPGYLVPKLVREEAGGHSKTPILPIL